MRATSRRAIVLLIALLLGLAVFAGQGRLGHFLGTLWQTGTGWPPAFLLTGGFLLGAAAATVLARGKGSRDGLRAQAGPDAAGGRPGGRNARDARSPTGLDSHERAGTSEGSLAESQISAGAEREAVDPGIVHAMVSAASHAPDLHGVLEAMAIQASGAFHVPSAAWIGSAGTASGLSAEAGAAIVEAARRIVQGESGVVAVNDWAAPPQEIPAGEAERFVERGVHSGLFVWFTSTHGQTGGLTMASPQPRLWTRSERALAAIAGTVLAEAAERQQQFEEAHQRIQLLERVRAFGLTLAHEASVADVAKTAGEGALSLAAADRAAVYLCQPDGTLSCAWSHNLSEAYVGQVIHYAKLLAGGRLMDGARPDLLELSGRGIDESGPSLYSDVEALAPAVVVPRLTRTEGYRAVGNWPLVHERKPLGLLSCYYNAPRTWSSAEQDVLQTFAETVAFAVHNAHLHDGQIRRAADLEVLFDLSRRLRAARNLEEIYPILVDHVAGLLNADSAAVLLLGTERAEFECAFAIGALSELRGTSFPIPGSPLGRVAREDLVYDTVNLGAEPLPVWMNGFRSLGPAVAVPLRSEREMIGVFCLGRRRRPDAGPFTDAEIRSFEGIAEIAGNAIRRARLFQNLEDAYMQTVVSLARTMDVRDSYTSGHSERISEWAEAVGRELGCAPEEIREIRWGALLHDIGKIGVPDAILRKPGKLTDAEWAIMRKHPEIGEEILGSTDRMRGVAVLVRHHQEKWNGTGYPDGLKGEEIPLGARILSVCDTYSAITDDRPYKRARTHEEAVGELHRCEGTQFDPRVVSAFCTVVERHRERDKLSRVR